MSEKEPDPTAPSSKHDEIRRERDRERRYRDKLRHEAANRQQPDGPRSRSWVSGKVTPLRAVRDGPLVGRVAFHEPDPDLGGATEFYLGDAHTRVDGIDVYNWRNPIASLFFDSAAHRPTIGNVTGTRTFRHTDNVIDDYVDDIVDVNPPNPLFGRRPVPPHQVPRATHTPTRPHVKQPNPSETRQAVAPHHPPLPVDSQQAQNLIDADDLARYVRAEPFLLEQLQAPRTKKLEPVLRTLQPEQYRLITASPQESMIIEGGPGTGKSIIASHRAAYFAGGDTPAWGQIDGHVLLVGPTERYTKYIGGLVGELTGNASEVVVSSLEGLPQILSEFGLYSGDALSRSARPTSSGSARSSDTSLEALVSEACRRLANPRKGRLTVNGVYDYLRLNGTKSRPLTDDPHWVAYLKNLPSYAEAFSRGDPIRKTIRRHLDGRARVGSSTRDSGSTTMRPHRRETTLAQSPKQRIGHIIVDEAQDVTIEDWLVLRQLNRGGTWTIVGDLNQRRADNTPKAWATVLRALGLPFDTPCRSLQRGYRSTTPILECASKLLPSGTPPPLAVRTHGPAPVFRNVIREHLGRTVADEVRRLSGEYNRGTIAVITKMPGPITAQLHVDPERSNVQVLPPNHARGLEFDAVVVVEPGDFGRNDHRRYGLLYTALTRANKELVIVHSNQLPFELRDKVPVVSQPPPAKPTPTGSKRRRNRNKSNQNTRRKPRATG